jgi:Family of unknown function (DUF5695)
MRILILRILAVAILTAVLPEVCGAQTVLKNDQFQVGFSDFGVATIKRVQDKYDTEYIAPGRNLGDLVIRYRQVGQKEWKRASAAVIDRAPAAGQTAITYKVGELVPTIATSSKPSASVEPWEVWALNDQVAPADSHQSGVPKFAWRGKKGTVEWVQYDFASPQKVASAEVYWAQEENPDEPIKLPKSWRVLYRDGDSWKEVSAKRGYPVVADQYAQANFAPVTTSALRIEAQLESEATAGIYEWRLNDEVKKVTAIDDLQVREEFHLDGDALVWSISLQNNTGQEMEVGDLGLPLRFNTNYSWDKTETYTRRVFPHYFIGGSGAFIFWMRPNAEGPYLLMTPKPGTQLEYFDATRMERGYAAYIHSAASGEELRAKGGTWRLPNTQLVMKPNGAAGDSASYGFRFRWAPDYDGVRNVLYQEGLFDVNVVPGMTVPTDLTTQFSLHTRNQITEIAPEHPEQTKIEYVGENGKDVQVYKVRFARLGENLLKVKYGEGQYLPLEFFVTEPLETLIKKRASFMVTHEQHLDPKLWYYGLISQWDMKHEILRSPDDLDGLQSYAVASDDPALGKAPYIAGENIYYPSQQEIDAVELYIKKFVWGGLQQTDKEPYPYAIYGIPNWKVNRDSPKDDKTGKKHIWRIYDYPHVVLLYYNMYQVAKDYPNMVKYLDADGYLERAFGTAKAFFTVPMEILQWSPYETGTYDELIIPELIQALNENGHKDQAEWLRAEWEKKAEHFINGHPNLYASEYPFDSTGFESTHAFAKYAMAHVPKPGESAPAGLPAGDIRSAVKYQDALAFLNEQMALNLACRGWLEPAYYDLGSDYRGAGNAGYTLSYMAQMGGWAVLDYALYFAHDPYPYARLGYASYLSSWALLNSGTPGSNYGYWYPGKNNDGGASGGFEPRPWGHAWLGNKEMGRGPWWYDGEIDLGFLGALRTAATVVVDDPIFKLYALGGDLQRNGNVTEVIPRDGLRVRFHVLRGNERLHILLGRDGFAAGQPVSFTDGLGEIKFTLENRASGAHPTNMNIAGLPAGTYQVFLENRAVQKLTVTGAEAQTVLIPMNGATAEVKITRVASAAD